MTETLNNNPNTYRPRQSTGDMYLLFVDYNYLTLMYFTNYQIFTPPRKITEIQCGDACRYPLKRLILYRNHRQYNLNQSTPIKLFT